jgi:hypothetical protein
MNIESKQFWEQVKKEYKPNEFFSICINSPTFEFAWNELNKKQIQKLAQEFIFYNFKYHGTYLGNNWLFLRHSGELDKEIRIDFIDWCIKKYS